MKYKTIIVAGALLAIVFLAGIWQINRLQNDIEQISHRITALSEKAPRSETRDIAPTRDLQLVEEVQEIGDAVKNLAQQFKHLSARLDSSSSGEETPLPQAETHDQVPPPRLSAEEQIAVLETTLNDTSLHDEIWSTATTTKISELINNAPEYQIADSVDVRCGGTLCLVDAQLSASAKRHEKNLFQVKLIMDLATELPRATIMDKVEPDGSTKYLFYMARDGYKLPTEYGDDQPISLQTVKESDE